MKKLKNKIKYQYAVATGSAISLASSMRNIQAAGELAQGMNIISKGMVAFGAVWTVWGIIVLAGGLNEHNGADIKQGMLRAIGGALVVAAAAWLTQIDFNFN